MHATYAQRLACIKCQCGACPYEFSRPSRIGAVLRKAVPTKRMLVVAGVRSTIATGLALVALIGGTAGLILGVLAKAFAFLALIGLLASIESAVIGGAIDEWWGVEKS